MLYSKYKVTFLLPLELMLDAGGNTKRQAKRVTPV